MDFVWHYVFIINMKLTDLIIEDETNWMDELKKTPTVHQITVGDNIKVFIIVVYIDILKGLEGNIYITVHLNDELTIPNDTYKVSMDEVLKNVSGIVPKENKLFFRIASCLVVLGKSYVRLEDYMSTYTMRNIKESTWYNDLIKPNWTDQYILSPNVLPTFGSNYKERVHTLEKMVHKLYQGFKTGKFSGHKFVLPDKYDVNITPNNNERKLGEPDLNVIPSEFDVEVSFSSNDIQYPNEPEPFYNLKRHLIDVFKKFNVDLDLKK